MDLEWNTVFDETTGDFLNEIIEIGAVKLDAGLRETGRFSQIVRSHITDKLSGRFKKLTNITNEEMLSGISFSEAVKEYTEWVGSDNITLSWSTSDIYALVDNFKSVFGTGKIPFITLYADAQSFVQQKLAENGEEIKSQISLAHAAEKLGVNIDNIELHRAVDDSALTAELFRRCFDETLLKRLTVNTAENDFYERLSFKPYYIKDIDDPLVDKSKLKFKCDNCRRFAKRKTAWKFCGNFFSAEFKCSGCGEEFLGRVSFKKKYDSVVVKKRKRPTSKDALKRAELRKAQNLQVKMSEQKN